MLKQYYQLFSTKEWSLEWEKSCTIKAMLMGSYFSTQQHKILSFKNKTSRTEDLTVYSFFLAYKQKAPIDYYFYIYSGNYFKTLKL